MQPEDLAHLDKWTPEQQVMALKYRMSFETKQSPFLFTSRPSDVIIAVPGKSGTTCVSHICHQLRMRGAEPDFDDQDKVVVWMEKAVDWYGNLTLNPKVMLISRKRCSLWLYHFVVKWQCSWASKFLKYLGVNISNNLTWSNHIDIVCSKARRMLGIIYRHFYTNCNTASLFNSPWCVHA